MNTLKYLRENMGLTQSQVAAIAGITQQAYSLIETGQNNPSLETALCLSKLFQKTVDDIFIFQKTI